MRTLYFDIDGTLLLNDHEGAKTCLENGEFERAVRESNIERLVCVGNFVDVARIAQEIESSYDSFEALFNVCSGVFANAGWFRDNVTLTRDASRRVDSIDFEGDWWYVDDLAEYYFAASGHEQTFRQEVGRRILVPTANGNGQDVLNWLSAIPK